MVSNNIPTVLAISGNDPSGGAGIMADIEAIISQGCHVLPIITCNTVQNTCTVASINPVAAEIVEQQARNVLEDLSVDAIKIGLLGHVDIVKAVYQLLNDYPDIPVILDPIIASTSGRVFAADSIIGLMQELLMPKTYLLTPNKEEALLLAAGTDNAIAAAFTLQEYGCHYVLITDTGSAKEHVNNRLYGAKQEIAQYNWPRLPNTYHGSGCTLSAACAGLVAQGLNIQDAVSQAQEFTWQSLHNGRRLGKGQYHPNRLFWAMGEVEEETGVPL